MSAPRNNQADARWSVYGDGWGGEGTILASCSPVAGHASRNGDCDDANATRYPGSAERNDGQDNSCPGTDGWGLVDEITGRIEFSDKANFCLGFQSGASGYDVARGQEPSFGSCGVLLQTTSACGSDFEDPQGGRAFHYLVRSSGPWEGSWGADSEGNARGTACP